ncbi:MAG: DNA methyltransferase [Terriglobia bacterium]
MSLSPDWNKPEIAPIPHVGADVDVTKFIPGDLLPLENPQTDIPRIARDPRLTRLIEAAVQKIPTSHTLNLGDARTMSELAPASVHLVLTSPPYWTLKEYRDSEGQMGHIDDYDEFLTELDKVWAHCFRALVPGGRLICVVGDVCL